MTFEEGQEQQHEEENQQFDEEGKWIFPYIFCFYPNSTMIIHFALFVELHKLDGIPIKD
jgi:hypothetical protein